MTGVRQSVMITNYTACLALVRDLVNGAVARSGFPAHQANRLQVAVDEAVTNVIEHGYSAFAPGTASIEVVVDADAKRFTVEIDDSAPSFHPDQVPAADIPKQMQSGRAHGLGVHLMRLLTDDIAYKVENGKRNRLVLTKFAS